MIKDTGGRRIFCRIDDNYKCDHEKVKGARHHKVVVIDQIRGPLWAWIYKLPEEKWDLIESIYPPWRTLPYYKDGSLFRYCSPEKCSDEEINEWGYEHGYHTFMKKEDGDMQRVFVVRNRGIENKTCGVERIKRLCECDIDNLPV